MMKICSVDGCFRKVSCRGLCNTHYHVKWQAGEFGNAVKRPKCSVPDCGKTVHARTFCSMHYQRFMEHGDPTAGRAFENERQNWFLEHKNYDSDECLIWPFGTSNGYGSTGIRLAHDLMLEMTVGERPFPKSHARHLCGNGQSGCVSPKHLRWGTAKENGEDRVIHGTSNRGVLHHSVILTEEQVHEIREKLAAGFTQQSIADQYGVGRCAIKEIKAGRNWKWLESPTE